ncbi:MAG: glucuronate isomerase [Verrucomicrobia bacterium]|nr:MAG: glucuronate isomerase [Verrucomicrobiota bacterium]
MATTATASVRRRAALAKRVEKIVATTPVFDIHTHLYDPAFRDLLLWGIDDLLTYHYLVAEAFRYFDIPFEKFWSLSKTQQADLIWNALFLRHSPISESCRGVLTTLNLLGLDVKKRDLAALRRWFAKQNLEKHVTRCLELAGVAKICMTNSPFDDVERPLWQKGFRRDEHFVGALRIDPLLLDWPGAAPRLAQWGYNVGAGLSDPVVGEVRRFLADWSKRIGAKYLMVSLPPDFKFPEQNNCAQLVEKAVLPHCREFGLPLALMLGVKRAVNPQLRLAGDGVGRSDLQALQNLCAGFQENKFLATVLSRENQHELCEEMTRMRLELLGLSVTLQHSDARVLDQLVYKWTHFREVISTALTDKYGNLSRAGWEPTTAEVERDVKDLLGGAFERFCRE